VLIYGNLALMAAGWLVSLYGGVLDLYLFLLRQVMRRRRGRGGRWRRHTHDGASVMTTSPHAHGRR
jgi:hypothetical protein